MNKICAFLLVAFIAASSIYIHNDSQRYKVKPCNPPVIIEDPIITSDTTENVTLVESDLPYTDQERVLLARVIMSEGSLLPMHGKIAIMATIMNRVHSDKYPNTIKEVLYNTGFSLGDNGEPTDECYYAIDDYVSEGWPADMYWFRDSYPHSYGYEYLHIGNMYFNTEKNYY